MPAFVDRLTKNVAQRKPPWHENMHLLKRIAMSSIQVKVILRQFSGWLLTVFGTWITFKSSLMVTFLVYRDDDLVAAPFLVLFLSNFVFYCLSIRYVVGVKIMRFMPLGWLSTAGGIMLSSILFKLLRLSEDSFLAIVFAFAGHLVGYVASARYLARKEASDLGVT